MNLILTNFGLRFAVEHSKSEFRQSKLPSEPDVGLLYQLMRDILIPYRTQPQEDLLIARGMATAVSESLSREEIVLRYQRNPLEHIQQVAIEFTTLCNMNCRHCYNATVPRVTEQNIGALKSAVDIFLAMGIERFDFIGGEVSVRRHDKLTP